MDHEGQDDVSPYSNLPLVHYACLECAWKCLFIKETLNAMKDALEPLCPRGAARCASRGMIQFLINKNKYPQAGRTECNLMKQAIIAGIGRFLQYPQAGRT